MQNASEAMGLADDWLNVPQLIKPEEIVDPNIDEQSMMTYLSQYPSAKLKQGAPLRPRTNPNRYIISYWYCAVFLPETSSFSCNIQTVNCVNLIFILFTDPTQKLRVDHLFTIEIVVECEINVVYILYSVYRRLGKCKRRLVTVKLILRINFFI